MSEVTGYVSEIEQELIDAVQFVPEKKYRKRQDYLGALIRAISDDLPDSEYDKLSDEATDWCEAAVSAYKEARELPDFPNGEIHDTSTPELDSDNETLAAEVDENREASATMADDEISEPQKEKKKRGRPPGKGKTKIAKATKEPKEKKGRQPPRGSNKWGVANSTKSDLVCKMLAQEGGTTMKDIIQATGHAHYNLVNRLVRHGHTIVKDGLNLKLIAKE